MATIDLEVFFMAARQGNIKCLKFCLENGVDIHSANDFALRIAAANGKMEVVKFLLENGANIHVLDDCLLRLASLNGKIQTVTNLLEYASCSHEAKLYAMFNAILYGHIDIVKLLLANGVSPYDNNGAVLKVVKMCKYDDIVALFEDYLN